MSAKTPFEIRLDILKMARELVMEEMYIKRDYNLELWHASDRKGVLTWPEFPDNDKILEKAKELYEFVAPSESQRRQLQNTSVDGRELRTPLNTLSTAQTRPARE